ncbi:MAG: acyltransferase family protein [Cetobacterium sp.]
MGKERSSNFELLRIFAMVLIVTHHYSIHGNWEFNEVISMSKLYIQFLSIGGKLGVNLFIMITGYFMCDSNYRVQTIKKIAIQTWVYSSFIYYFILLV